VTIACAASVTFAGIRRTDVPGFIIAQMLAVDDRDVALPLASPSNFRRGE
jgi:hypothetical protein